MKQREIKQIADYLSGVQRGNLRGGKNSARQIKLEMLCQIIQTLSDEIPKEPDKKIKSLLAFLELKARSCKTQIEGHLETEN